MPANGSLFGKRVFANTIKALEMSSSWIIRMSPKSRDKCPETGDTQGRGPCDTEAKVGVELPQEHKKLGAGGENPPRSLRGEHGRANTLISNFQPPGPPGKAWLLF